MYQGVHCPKNNRNLGMQTGLVVVVVDTMEIKIRWGNFLMVPHYLLKV